MTRTATTRAAGAPAAAARRRLLAGLLALGLAAALPAGPAAADAGPDREAVRRLVLEEALRTPVPPALALALAKVESDFQARALSARGARGVLQLAPEAARAEFGVDPDELWDPRLNVELGLDRLARLHARYGSWDLALAHHHAGGVEGEGPSARPRPESRAFVEAVRRWQARYAAQAELWVALRGREDGAAAAPAAPDGPAPDARAARRDRAAPPGRWVVRWDDGPPRRDRRGWRIDPEWRDIDTRRALARATLDDFSPRLVRWEP